MKNLTNQQDHLKKQIKSLHEGSKSQLEEEIKNFELNVKSKEREILDVSYLTKIALSKSTFLSCSSRSKLPS
jgi:hypothetical protein